jgi:hypothetical protein
MAPVEEKHKTQEEDRENGKIEGGPSAVSKSQQKKVVKMARIAEQKAARQQLRRYFIHACMNETHTDMYETHTCMI